MEISVEDLCNDLPKEFALLLNYAKKLKFEEQPDYHYLKGIFQQLFKQLFSTEKKELCLI